MNKFLKIGLVSTCLLSANVFAIDRSPDDRFFYIGGEAGVVEPVKKKFRHKESKTQITLKRSSMYSGKFGYSFYPQMSLEFSATYQPTYKLGYLLPATTLTPKTPGKTKVASEIYMLNLIYDFETYDGFTPFLILGGGLAQLKIKETSSSLAANNLKFFKINKSSVNCPAWQLGIGLSKDLSSNFSIDVTTKLQVVNNIKIKYQKYDPSVGKLVAQSPIKKTIGVWEFGIGFTYRLPF